MDRDRGTIRDEIFSLDPHSQGVLVEEIVEHLAKSEPMERWLREAERRDKEWDEGLVQGIDASEAIKQARGLLRT